MSDIRNIEPEEQIILGTGPCILEERFTLSGTRVIQRFDPKKLSIYGQMTLAHYAAIKKGRLLLNMSLARRLRSIFIRILETSYLENSEGDQELREYYKKLLDNSHLMADFLIHKIEWLHGKVKDDIASQDEHTGNMPQSMKATEFYKFLLKELVSMIRYFEEYVFIQNNRSTRNFGVILQKYRHILLWGVSQYSGIMRINEKEDLYQEFSLVLWKCVNTWAGFSGVKKSRSKSLGFTPYLKSAIRNKCTDIWRSNETSKRKVRGLTVGCLDDGEDSFASQLVAKQITNNWMMNEHLLLHSDSMDEGL